MRPSGANRTSTVAGEPARAGGPGYRSFRRRTILFTAGALVAAIALTFFVVRLLAREREQAIALWEARLSSMSEDRKAALEAWVSERRFDALLLLGFPSVRSVLSAGPDRPASADTLAHVREVLEGVTRDPAYDFAALVLPDGTVLVGAGRFPVRTFPAPPPQVGYPASGPGVVRFLRREDGRPEIATWVPAAGSEGGTFRGGGILLLSDPAVFVYPLLSREPVKTRSGETLLGRRDGSRVTFLSPLRFVSAAPGTYSVPVSTENLALARTLRLGPGSGSARDYRGVPIIAAGSLVEGTDWALVAKIDREEAIAAAATTIRRGSFGLVALLLGLAAATWGIWRNENLYRLREVAAGAEQYRLFLRQARDAILFVEPGTGRILETNPAAEAMYGRGSAELRAMTVADLRPEEERAAVPGQIERARQEGILVEATHRKGDGTAFPVEISSRRAEANGREVLLSIVRDVSERHAARETEELLNRLVRTTSEVNRLVVRERDGQHLLEEACRIAVEHGGFVLAFVAVPDGRENRLVARASFGRTGYLEGLDIRTDDSPLGQGPTGRAFREGRPVIADDWDEDATVSPWRRRAEGFGIRASGAFPLGGGASPVGVLTVYADSTGFFCGEVTNLVAEMADNLAFALAAIAEEERRRAAESALAESERRHRLLFDANPAPMWVVEKESLRFLAVNEAAVERYGYTRGEFLSMTLREIRPPEDVEAMEKVALEKSGGPRQPGTWRHRKKDGTLLEVEIATHDILFGDVPARLVLASDVTEKRRAEREVLRLNAELEDRVQTRTSELQAANRELESFAYSVSHDLRAPLRAIDGFGKILEDSHAGGLDDEGRRLLRVVRTNAKRMGSLIDDLLAFSRAGRHEIRKSRVEMRLLVAAVWLEILPEDEKGRSVFVLGPLPDAWGDTALLRQVWTNLLSNAVKFTSKNPARRIEVGGRRGKDGPEWFVKDDGVGFDMKYAERLFGVFSRLHSPREFDGTGVGLALVQKIVARHGGAIRGESEPGKGATFTFTIPDPARRERAEPVEPGQEATWTRSES